MLHCAFQLLTPCLAYLTQDQACSYHLLRVSLDQPLTSSPSFPNMENGSIYSPYSIGLV